MWPLANLSGTLANEFSNAAASGPAISNINPPPVTRSYLFTGIYPINYSSSPLAYSSNDIMTVSVTFNVDQVVPLFAQCMALGAGI
jgi:hypothetical protein